MAVSSQRGGTSMTRTLSLLITVLATVTSAGALKQQHHHQQQQQKGLASDIFSNLWPDVGRLTDVAQWRVPIFDFEGNLTMEQEYRNSGRYDPPSMILIGALIIGTHTYVTLPLFKPGTPASFCIVAGSQTLDPPLRPFPSWEAHATNQDALVNCSRQMVSVFRGTIHSSNPNIVYLIDSGRVNLMDTFEQLCDPKIVTLDVASATILNTTVIDKQGCNSLYIAIEVEKTSDGRLVAYSADVTGFALAVTDLGTGQTHRVMCRYFYPTPSFGITTIAGVRSYLMDGLFTLGVARGVLYFWAFASNTLNKVDTQVLRNATDGDILDLTVETLVRGERAGPAGALAIDPMGKRMFFGIAEQEALYCWDTRKPYQQFFFRLLAKIRERLQFTSTLNMLHDNKTLLIVTNKYHMFGQGIVDQNSVNYRVMSMNISNLNC